MTLPFELEEPAPIPGAGPTSRLGPAIAVHIAATSASQKLLGGDAILVGWSFRESTGLAGALAELYDGGDAGGTLLGILSFSGGADPAASQSAQAATASGGNAAQAATITPGAGVTAFIQSLRITGLGATAAAQVTATLAGVTGGTINYPVSVPAGVTVPITPIFDGWGTVGLPGSAPATAITLTLPAFGAGNTLESASISGYFRNQVGFTDRQSFGLSGLYVQSALYLNMITGSIKGSIWIRR